MKVSTMDDGPNSANLNLNGQLGQSVNSVGGSGKQNQDDNNQRTPYSIPGILHFIQHEWARFEMERSQWEVERAEFQARIAFLQGERKGQENLKNDLVRRIKMLEYALKQERAKFHKLKYGTELQQGDLKPPVFEDGVIDTPADGESIFITNSNVNWRQGRQLLRQYLQEIGYTDTIIDVRSNRVRSLLGICNANDKEENHNNLSNLLNGTEQPNKRSSEFQGRRTPAKKIPPASLETMITDTEAAVMANFAFLAQEGVEVDDDDDMSDDLDDTADEEADEVKRNKVKTRGVHHTNEGLADDVDAETEEVMNEFSFLSSESEDSSHEVRMHSGSSDWGHGSSSDWRVSPSHLSQLKEQYRRDRAQSKKGPMGRPKRSALQNMLTSLGLEEESPAAVTTPPGGSSIISDSSPSSPGLGTGILSSSSSTSMDIVDGSGVSFSGTGTGPTRRGLVPPPAPIGIGPDGTIGNYISGNVVGLTEEGIDGTLGLGELAQLTVNNEAESYDQVSATKDSFRKTWTAKYTLRSHFDGVRALAFHPVEPVLVTASEDCTLKLWNLQKTIPAKKTASLDVEPVYTFRGHVGPVLCLAMTATGEQCFSGGLDGAIHCWNIPSSNIDPYDSYDPSVLGGTLLGHTDAVWGLSLHSQRLHLLSCSADGTVRLWNPAQAQSQGKSPLLSLFASEPDGIPTSVDFVRDDPGRMVTAFNSGACVIYDLETGKPVTRLDTETGADDSNPAGRHIHRVISHPTLPVTITAHEDRHIRFFNNGTGRLLHSMVAHLDAVTCLAVDPHGIYLLSGSHDCSIRLWNLDNKTCVQEITAHRKKFDESIFDVAFHPSKPFIASAGADALAKVFV